MPHYIMEGSVSFDDTIVVSFVEDYSQKCYFPPDTVAVLDCYVGDYVFIYCELKSIICKVYCRKNVDFIQADETVSVSNNFAESVNHCKVHFPYDVRTAPAKQLNRIKIRIILSSLEALVKWSSTAKFDMYIRAILSQYGVVSDCTINCQNHSIGRLCGICKIQILDIFQENEIIGMLAMWTIIDVESVKTEEQMSRGNSIIELGGLDDVIIVLKSVIDDIMARKYKLCPRILLTGPPGCGKSSLVKKLASQMNTHFICARPSNLCRLSSNECENFFDIVSQAGQLSSRNLVILFIDDIDCDLVNKSERSKVLYFTLALLDMCREYKNFMVFGAANTSRNLHSSLKRFGRFTKEVYIGVPTLEQREKILEVHTTDLNVLADIKEIARETPGYVGSDLYFLVRNADRIASNATTAYADNIDENVTCGKTTVTAADFENALKSVKPSILKHSKFKTNVQPMFWEDIGGLEAIKKRAKMYIQWPILHPLEFAKVGLPCPKGVLLFGPPGCCKTTLVRVLATECKATFLSASPAEIYASHVGESEKSIIELFHQARLCAPAIIFLDEIDSLVGRRSYSDRDKGVHEKVLTTLLNEMDGFGVKTESLQGITGKEFAENQDCSGNNEKGSHENVIVVGATNRIDLIDDALLRPGRFDSLLYVPPPNAKERKAVLQTIAKKMNLDDELLEWLANKTEFFSGADLKDLCRIAGISAIKENSNVTKKHFVSALKLAHPSITTAQLKNYEQWASKYGPVISN